MQAIDNVLPRRVRVLSQAERLGDVMMPIAFGVPTPKVRILVADDAHIMVRTLAAILELGGYDACALYGGEAALKLLVLFKPELVMTDVSSPLIASVEIAPDVALALPHCKVLLFTENLPLHSLLGDGSTSMPAFEVVTRQNFSEALLKHLGTGQSSGQPPVLVPIELSDTKVH